jgi:hypothetical protein
MTNIKIELVLLGKIIIHLNIFIFFIYIRIKIEPTKGIPTRFLGPTALPESLADMLIKQVYLFKIKTNIFILFNI